MSSSSEVDPYSDYENDDGATSSLLQTYNEMANYLNRVDRPPRSPQRRTVIERNREEGHARLFNDYFANNPTYNDRIFRRRFRMDRPLFLRVVNEVERHCEFFQQRSNAAGRLGLSSLQKCTAALRQLAYGTTSDAVDEYLRLSATSARNSLSHFCDTVIERYSAQYLRRPTQQDQDRLLRMAERRGFPGMLGSIDCMHWEWKNCPTAWKGQYQGRSKSATLILEAVASHDLWIWHSFFGIPGSLNDINVLQRSPVFDDVLNGVAPSVDFQVNGHHYDMGYYLTDGIYPQWATFVPSVAHPQTRKQRVFSTAQESCRKDVERAFGVLQARFAILRKPSLAWNTIILSKIMTTCIILHNMIVEDERHKYANYDDMSEFWADKPIKPVRCPGERKRTDWVDQDDHFNWIRQNSAVNTVGQYMARRRDIRDKNMHLQLKEDLIEHIYALNPRTM